VSILVVALVGILGALIGSFANVVIHRAPRGESIVFPGSHCPRCGHRLGPLELVPVVSFLVLRGRCRSCGGAIGWRYPAVEAAMAALFVLVALRYPVLDAGPSLLPVLAVGAMLMMAVLIDLDHYVLPDALTLPALALALAGSLLYAPGVGLPTPRGALVGALAGAGVLALVNRLGALILRRLGDTHERLWPVSLDQVNLAALGGALGGWPVGLAVGAASVVANLVARRPLRLPEGPLYGLWLVALVLSTTSFTVAPVAAVGGSVLAAGAWALVGALFWWAHDLLRPTQETDAGEEEDDEPVAMGFGDVKLAAVLGAMLGWQSLLVGLFLAVTLGAVAGIGVRLAGGDRVIPFGPALFVGGVLALFFGHGILTWYLGLLGAA